MRDEFVEVRGRVCAVSLSKGWTLTLNERTSTSSARIYDCTRREAQGAEAQRTYALSAAAATKRRNTSACMGSAAAEQGLETPIVTKLLAVLADEIQNGAKILSGCLAETTAQLL